MRFSQVDCAKLYFIHYRDGQKVSEFFSGGGGGGGGGVDQGYIVPPLNLFVTQCRKKRRVLNT